MVRPTSSIPVMPLDIYHTNTGNHLGAGNPHIIVLLCVSQTPYTVYMMQHRNPTRDKLLVAAGSDALFPEHHTTTELRYSKEPRRTGRRTAK